MESARPLHRADSFRVTIKAERQFTKYGIGSDYCKISRARAARLGIAETTQMALEGVATRGCPVGKDGCSLVPGIGPIHNYGETPDIFLLYLQ